MSSNPSIKKFETFLDQYLNFEKTPVKNIFWLETMKYFCTLAHHPENSAPCFHVAGSKGKGSISKFLVSILEEAGFKTGMYTSPHILDFIERVSGGISQFDDQIYEKSVDEIMNLLKDIHTTQLPGERPVTWFELVTLFGFIVFRQAKVDYSVYETGLGGRLDSTNVVTPLCSCIGPIELEHTEFLGDTVEKIAFEKGGIIKENGKAVIAKQIPSVRKVFEEIAAEKNAEIHFVDDLMEDLAYRIKNDGTGLMNVSFNCPRLKLNIKTDLQMTGSFQAENAALAAITIRLCVPEITDEQIASGLSKAVLPARFEIIKTSSRSTVVLDGAHTVNSVRFTLDSLEKVFSSRKDNFNLLFGCAADKDVNEISRLFKGRFNKVFLTKPGNVKACDITQMKKAFDTAGINYDCNEDYEIQIKKALDSSSQNGSVLLVTGSFYLVSETKKILNQHKL